MPKADILIVEDDRIVAEDTKITLKKLGFGVSGIVPSGEEVLKKVETEPPDLVLMDIELEGKMDGIEAAARIRDRFNIPVVYVTGYADEDVLERAKVTEPFGYIVKPFEDRELNSAIEIALYKHKMETKLKESEKKYRSLYNNVPIGLFRSTPQGKLVSVNQELVQMLGYKTASELMKIPTMEIYADPERRKDLFAHLHEKGTVKNFEMIAKHRNGKNIWVSTSIQAQFDHNGNIIFLDGIGKNITQRKESEAAIQKASREWTLAMDAFDDVIYLLDNDLCLVQANSAFYKLWGVTPDQAIGRHIVEIIHPQGEDKPCPVCLAQEEKRDFVMIMEADVPNNPAKKSIEITVKIVRNEDGTPSGILMNLHDLTTSRAGDEILRQYEHIISATNDHMSFLDRDYTYLAVNDAYLITHKKERSQIIGHTVADTLGDDVFEQLVKEKLDRCLAGEKINYEEWFDFPGLGRRYMDVNYYPYAGSDGIIFGVVVSSHDITEHKLIEKALNEEMQLRNTLIEALPYPTMLIKKNRTIIFANKVARDIGARVGGICWQDFGHSDYIPEKDKEYINQHKTTKGLCSHCTFCLADKALADLKPFIAPEVEAFGRLFETYWIPVSDNLYLHYALDITEKKQTEVQLFSSLDEKVVLLREIHHRVKNNMQVIISLLSLHGRRINDANLSKVFEDCRDRINAMSLIHESLYQSDNLAKIDFKVYLKKLCRNLGQAYGASGKGISLAVGECNVALDMDQGIAIGMVIAELISNAFKHAFPTGKGGNVSINLSELDAENVKLIIKDDGKGMPPKIDIMNSPSLGLRLAVSAVTLELGGSIEIDRDKGTQFTICFKYKRK